MVAEETSNQNFFSTTLSSSITDSDTTIPLNSVGSLSSPALLVLDPESDTKREVIRADGTWSGNSAVLSSVGNRGLAGSASGAQSHASGTTVVSVPLAQHLEDAHDRIDTHVHDGATDDTAVSHTDLSDLTTGDPHTQYFTTARHDSDDHSAVDHSDLTGLTASAADHTDLLAADGTTELSGALYEGVDPNATSGTTPDLDWSAAPVHEVTLTGNATFTFSNVPTNAGAITLILHQDGTGSRTAAWPAAVEWAGGTAPTITTDASATDVLTFVTPDGGTTVYGFVGGQDFS